MTRDYKEDIKIDENNLEEEWIEQGSLFLYYAEAHADASHEKDMNKSRLDLIYAQKYSSIKESWEEYFSSKPTEPAIKEFIIKSSDYQKAEKRLINSMKNANIMLAAKSAFEHRKRALENLVSLRISGFYSEPRNKTQKVINKGGHTAQKKSLGRISSRAKSRIKRKKEI